MIKLTNLKKSFKNNHVLDGVDLDVTQGESLVIIGGSGTGKSVLLKCILGLVTPDAGTITIDKQPLTAKTRPAFLNRFGMLFQGAALFDSLPLWENVAFRLLQNGQDRARARATAIEKLARVGLGPDTADRLPAELSGGMQKRAGLARAIAADPQVIFFDEPTAGLDPILAGTINRLIRDIVDETQATTISITHDMTTVHTVADRVAMLHAGRIQWQGSIPEMNTSSDAYLTQFIHGQAKGPIETLR